jgi:uncharacterized protein HemX
MLSFLRQALTSPVTGPIATSVALALAVALGVSSAGWETKQARYEARIAELSQNADRTQASLRTELAACHAAGDARRLMEAKFAEAGKTPEGAKQLLEQQPEGIDACARMESADRAVLSNLKR